MLLEQNQSKHALNKNLKGGFYLRKKPLDGCAPGYSYSDFAIAQSYPRQEQRSFRLAEVFDRFKSYQCWMPQVRGPHGQVFVRGVEISILRPGKVTIQAVIDLAAGSH